ncbi:RHS repeat-associated core domain-containing protein [Salmonella enterica]|nr:RHS repeat-associated core domain-containing protein [Salmonella enterica]EBR7421654.1 RHS repeat-associated core domain-containing protein [Salmonella enterica]ECS8285742.1 RHS repeat-associated core domain-containing protein [Salmonella enterica]EDG2165701.1 hypothetical protein [Salmonella enterica]EDQ4523495.1 RHS repeat-associated core domain-containing protein [Salmonella enterica]
MKAGTGKTPPPAACRLRFPGEYEDEGSGFYYNRFRYYDAETGQYLCADPIGQKGGINTYRYAPNPLGWIDPLGLTNRYYCRWYVQNDLHLARSLWSCINEGSPFDYSGEDE